MKGTYLLILQLETSLAHLEVGRLGACAFAAGFYLYVGSAFGPGGIPARLAHHQHSTERRPHWHIDYLRPHARLLEAWSVSGGPRRECTWCTLLATIPDLSMPMHGFGSSDTDCPAHLFYTPIRPQITLFSHLLADDLLNDSASATRLALEVHVFDYA